jgi:hypothetical protein
MLTAAVPPLPFHAAGFSLRERFEKTGNAMVTKMVTVGKNQGRPFGLPFS